MPDFIPPPVNTSSPFADMRGHHVAVRTPDLDAAKRFYVGTLDFRVVALPTLVGIMMAVAAYAVSVPLLRTVISGWYLPFNGPRVCSNLL